MMLGWLSVCLLVVKDDAENNRQLWAVVANCGVANNWMTLDKIMHSTLHKTREGLEAFLAAYPVMAGTVPRRGV